ncbi:MAG TPA: energy transducer TonB [Alphaproteobacteria bacterium]
MIRLTTLIWVALASVVGFGLFQLKHKVQELEDELARLNRAVLAEQQAIHVLKAEWSYINQPQRLEALVLRHLDLQPMTPEQLGVLADVPMRTHEEAPIPATAPTPRPVLSSAPAGTRQQPSAKAVPVAAHLSQVTTLASHRPASKNAPSGASTLEERR